MKKYFSIIFISFVVVLSLVVGIFAYQNLNKKDLSKLHGTFLNSPRAISNFELKGIDSKSFNNASLKDRWTLMFFGFTNCQYMCPTIMTELKTMYNTLIEKNVSPLPNVVMVSLDPDRDMNKLSKYVKSFNNNFYGAYDDLYQIQTLTQELGVVYMKVTGKDSEDYDIEHTGTVLLFNPQGQLTAFFTWPLKAQFIADDYMLLVS